MSTPPPPRTLTVAVSGLSRAEADRILRQLEAMGHPQAVVTADDGAPLPDMLAVVVRRSQLGGTVRLAHVVGVDGAVAEAERLAVEPGGPVLAGWAPCSWAAYQRLVSALWHRSDGAGWYRLGAPPGAANLIDSVLSTGKDGPVVLVRMPVAERVAPVGEVAR